MQMNAYAKSFDENSKYINFLVKDEKIFQKKKKNEIWNKIGSLFLIEIKNVIHEYLHKNVNTQQKIKR